MLKKATKSDEPDIAQKCQSLQKLIDTLRIRQRAPGVAASGKANIDALVTSKSEAFVKLLPAHGVPEQILRMAFCGEDDDHLRRVVTHVKASDPEIRLGAFAGEMLQKGCRQKWPLLPGRAAMLQRLMRLDPFISGFVAAAANQDGPELAEFTARLLADHPERILESAVQDVLLRNPLPRPVADMMAPSVEAAITRYSKHDWEPLAKLAAFNHDRRLLVLLAVCGINLRSVLADRKLRKAEAASGLGMLSASADRRLALRNMVPPVRTLLHLRSNDPALAV